MKFLLHLVRDSVQVGKVFTVCFRYLTLPNNLKITPRETPALRAPGEVGKFINYSGKGGIIQWASGFSRSSSAIHREGQK